MTKKGVWIGLATVAAGLVWLLSGKAEASPQVYSCPYCGLTFSTYEGLEAHIAYEHPDEEIPPERPSIGIRFLALTTNFDESTADIVIDSNTHLRGTSQNGGIIRQYVELYYYDGEGFGRIADPPVKGILVNKYYLQLRSGRGWEYHWDILSGSNSYSLRTELADRLFDTDLKLGNKRYALLRCRRWDAAPLSQVLLMDVWQGFEIAYPPSASGERVWQISNWLPIKDPSSLPSLGMAEPEWSE